MNSPTDLTRRLLANTFLVIGAVLFCAILVLLAELGVRIFTDVGRLGTERALFVNDAFPGSIGNRKSTNAIAFGVRVHTDEMGFRTNPRRQPKSNRPELVVLGDSVGFGVGVEFDDVSSTLVEQANPGVTVVNTSVIGYGIQDYENVANAFVFDAERATAAIVVLLCLNDAWITSAERINESVTSATRPSTEILTTTLLKATVRGAAPVDASTVAGLKQNPFVSRINELLRGYSSLYVLARGALTDPRDRYWRMLAAAYERLDDVALAQILEPLARLASRAEQEQVDFHVVIQPFARQMLPDTHAAPQKRIAAYLRDQSISFVDLLPEFRQAETPGGLFLPYDPMHLSPRGHAIVAAAINDFWRRVER
jgi:hypothetical protein